MTFELRDYQRQAIDAIETDWSSGINRTGIVMSTGLGKTSVIGGIAVPYARDGARVLVIAHRAELLDHATHTCRQMDPSIPVGRVQAARNESRRPITMAMAPTLANAKRRARLVRKDHEYPYDVVIVDEAHHAASPSYMTTLGWAGSFDHVRTLGVTATMVRGDKRRLGEVWQNVCFERGIDWAIGYGPSLADPSVTAPVGAGAERAWLVRPRARVVVTDHMDLEHAKISKGDFQEGELGEMVAQDVDQIVKAWHEHAADRITVAFVPSVDSARALHAEYLSHGIAAEVVLGTTPLAERGNAAHGTGIYGRLARGETRVLVNVGVATEGFDCPPVSCILMARPTRLPGLYQQAIGRGLRQAPGKTDCLVLDVVGASRRQKLVTLVDLLASAEVDTSELDALPCGACGGYLAEPSDAAPFPCTCVTEAGEPVERDPDGGRLKLEGPAEYEDVDLFARSEFTWLFTRRGIRFLPAGDRIVVLWPDSGDVGQGDEGTYSIGHMVSNAVHPRFADPTAIDGDVPHDLGEARQIAERWAYRRNVEAGVGYSAKKASWRAGKPSEKQINYATKLGIRGAELMGKGRLGDEISIALASRLLDRVGG
jgi:superfamily II DNA or RNA helicase